MWLCPQPSTLLLQCNVEQTCDTNVYSLATVVISLATLTGQISMPTAHASCYDVVRDSLINNYVIIYNSIVAFK